MGGTNILSMRVENLNFVDSLNVLPMSLKSMPKSFELTRKKARYTHFSNTDKNLDYVGPHPELNYYVGRTLCLVMSVPNFWTGMRSKKTKFSIIKKNCWPIAWMM